MKSKERTIRSTKAQPSNLHKPPTLLKPLTVGRLTALQKLDLSKKVSLSKKSPSHLTPLAVNGLESVAALFLKEIVSDSDLPIEVEARRFVFRCFLVPQLFAKVCINYFSKRVKEPPLWLFEHACYLIACERTHLEMVCQQTQESNNSFGTLRWDKPIGLKSFGELPKPTIDWFGNPPGSVTRWSMRFKKWHKAAHDSFNYYLGTLTSRINIKNYQQPPEFEQTIRLGIIHKRSPFPPELLEVALKHLKTFNINAQNLLEKSTAVYNTPSVSDHPDIDTWLIEIWPLVVEQKWKYPDISRLAHRKFKGKGKPLTATDSKGMEARCERLNLRLAASAQLGGRPRKFKSTDQTHQPNEMLALWIDSIGIKHFNWLLGQRA